MYVYSVIDHKTIWGFLSAYRGGGWFEVYLVCTSRAGEERYTRISNWTSRYIKVREGNGMIQGHFLYRKDGMRCIFSPVQQQLVPEDVKQLRIELQQEGYLDLI